MYKSLILLIIIIIIIKYFSSLNINKDITDNNYLELNKYLNFKDFKILKKLLCTFNIIINNNFFNLNYYEIKNLIKYKNVNDSKVMSIFSFLMVKKKNIKKFDYYDCNKIISDILKFYNLDYFKIYHDVISDNLSNIIDCKIKNKKEIYKYLIKLFPSHKIKFLKKELNIFSSIILGINISLNCNKT